MVVAAIAVLSYFFFFSCITFDVLVDANSGTCSDGSRWLHRSVESNARLFDSFLHFNLFEVTINKVSTENTNQVSALTIYNSHVFVC